MSPLLNPCAVAVTTMGVALVAPVIALMPTSAVPVSIRAAANVCVSQSRVPPRNPSRPRSNSAIAIVRILPASRVLAAAHPYYRLFLWIGPFRVRRIGPADRSTLPRAQDSDDSGLLCQAIEQRRIAPEGRDDARQAAGVLLDADRRDLRVNRAVHVRDAHGHQVAQAPVAGVDRVAGERQRELHLLGRDGALGEHA